MAIARTVAGLPVVRAAALASAPTTQAWLVETLWSHLAVGFIAGHPKVGKSWLALDLAVSVASGTACLGRFPVVAPGPVLVYLAEDALPRVRERLVSICSQRALAFDDLDLFVITAPALRLDQPADQAKLSATLRRLKPRLLVLDPLVRLHALDENDAHHISSLLGFLRTLSRDHQLAIVVVHHLAKRHRRELGQNLRGSGDLHAWSDSAAYLVRRHDQILLTVEHRAAAPPAPIVITLATEPSPHLVCAQANDGAPTSAPPPLSLADRIRALLTAERAPLPRTVLRQRLRVNNYRLGEALAQLEQQRIIARTAHGWLLSAAPAPAPVNRRVAAPTAGTPQQIALPLG